MTSSSAYAAPLELDLRLGRFEITLRALVLLMAIATLLLAALPPWLMGGLGVLALLVLMREIQRARQRPQALRLHADGSVECWYAGDDWRSARLVQADWYLGLPHLQLRAGDGPVLACTLLPDRVGEGERQRLRVWLQTHAPQADARGLAA